MDLTKYGASPYGQGNPNRGAQNQSPLAAALRGVLGQEEPGSVLDPATAGNKSINSGTNLASILSDLIPAKGATGVLPAIGGIFIGPKAKTWNAKAAAEATKLLRAGHDPEYVRKLTGTSLFPDGMLRQEISDHNAQLTRMLMPDAKPDVLGAQLSHPELEAAYPEKMKNVVARLRGSSETGGEYRSGKIKVTADNASNAKSTLLHEIQHDIQASEGFARGGSPAEFMKDAEWAAKARGLDPSWAEKKAWLDYSKLAGEAEARLVQQRRMLTPEERLDTPLNWDVPPERQKVINYDDTAEVPAAMATVWHGSPHKFDAFDSSKIGTGEGAQAYGHGLYLADSPEVAKGYIPKTAHNDTVRKFLNELPEDAGFDELVELLGTGHFTREQDAVIKALRDNDWLGFDYPSQAISQAYKPSLTKNFDPSQELVDAISNVGHHYKVDLPDEHIAKMLDWDKPLSQQHPDVQAPFAQVAQPTDTGQMAWMKLKRQAWRGPVKEQEAERAVADQLRQSGIPGTRYLDGSSRGVGQGTSNYVMFPGGEDALTILERNGELVNQLRKPK